MTQRKKIKHRKSRDWHMRATIVEPIKSDSFADLKKEDFCREIPETLEEAFDLYDIK